MNENLNYRVIEKPKPAVRLFKELGFVKKRNVEPTCVVYAHLFDPITVIFNVRYNTYCVWDERCRPKLITIKLNTAINVQLKELGWL